MADPLPLRSISGRRRTYAGLGATGAGKSFALNFLLVQALQYDPRILILDLGGSYRWLTQFLGGGYMAVPGKEVSSYAPSLYRQESGPTNS